MKKSRGENTSRKFWNKEYKKGEHLALSTEPSEDLVKFSRWLLRETGQGALRSSASVLDVGCGNGRNLVYLAQEFGCRGVGFDISQEAISQGRKLAAGLPIEFAVRNMKESFPLLNESQTLVLDMMTSQILDSTERGNFVKEIVRVLRSGGFLFFKTFLLDEDRHATRLLREYPGKESGSYVHPRVGVEEHVFTESEIRELLEPHFTIRKITKSHKHIRRGRAWKRRTISVYAEKV